MCRGDRRSKGRALGRLESRLEIGLYRCFLGAEEYTFVDGVFPVREILASETTKVRGAQGRREALDSEHEFLTALGSFFFLDLALCKVAGNSLTTDFFMRLELLRQQALMDSKTGTPPLRQLIYSSILRPSTRYLIPSGNGPLRIFLGGRESALRGEISGSDWRVDKSGFSL